MAYRDTTKIKRTMQDFSQNFVPVVKELPEKADKDALVVLKNEEALGLYQFDGKDWQPASNDGERIPEQHLEL